VTSSETVIQYRLAQRLKVQGTMKRLSVHLMILTILVFVSTEQGRTGQGKAVFKFSTF